MDIKEDKSESSTTADSLNCENINITGTSSENKGDIKSTKNYEEKTMELQESSQPLSPNSTIDSEDDFSMIYDNDENSLNHQKFGDNKSKMDNLNKPQRFVKDIKLSPQPNKEKKYGLEKKSIETMDINASDIDSSEAEGDYLMIPETIDDNDDNSKLGNTTDSDKDQKNSETNANTTMESDEDFSLLLEPDFIEDENTLDETKISNDESFKTDKSNIETGITNKDLIDDFCLVTEPDIIEKSIDNKISLCEDKIEIITPSEKETEKQNNILGDAFQTDNNKCVASQKLNDESNSKTCNNIMTEASNEAFNNKLLTDEITKTIDESKSNKKINEVNEIVQDSVISKISDYLETKPRKNNKENTEKNILESDVNTIKEVEAQNVNEGKLFKDDIDCESIQIKANNSENNRDIKSADIKIANKIDISSDNTSRGDTKIKSINKDIDEEQLLNDNCCIRERTSIYKIRSDETESLKFSSDSMDIDNTNKSNKEMKQNETVSTEKKNLKVIDKLNSDTNSKIIKVGIEPVTSDLVPKNSDIIDLLPEAKKVEITDIQDQFSKLNAIKSNEEERFSKLIDSQPSTSKEITSEINIPENKKVEALKDIDEHNSNKVKEHQLSMSSTTEIPTDASDNIMKLKDLRAQIKQAENLESQDLEKQQASVKSMDPQLSTSLATEMTPDASDEIPEVTDSLGLLAETIRSVEDEDQEDDDDGDDEEDDYQDDGSESCPMTTEHSEDSNTHQSETEQGKDQPALPVESNTPNFETDANAENAMDSFTKVDDETSKTDTQKSDLSSDKDKVVIPMDVVEDESTEKPTTTETESVEKPSDGGVELKSGVEPEKPVETPSVEDNTKSQSGNILLGLLREGESPAEGASTCDLLELNQAKSKKLEIHKNKTVYNIVDLEESSSDDDVKIQAPATETLTQATDAECKVTELDTQGDKKIAENVPNKCDSPEATTSDETPIVALEPSRQKTSESADDKPTASVGTETQDPYESHKKSLLEIFNLDSDDDDKLVRKNDKPKETKLEHPKTRGINKCCNQTCTSADSDKLSYVAAPQFVLSYYQITNKRHSKLICTSCYHFVSTRMFGLLEDYKDVKPLSDMEMEEHGQELVEISDSDSDTEDTETIKRRYDIVTAEDIEHLEVMELESILEETWNKYNLDDRLKTAKDTFEQQVLDLESESKKIDDMFKDCQTMTDTLRRNLYATFAENIQEMEPINIIEPEFVPTLIKLRPSKPEEPTVLSDDTETRRSKRTKRPTNSTLNTSNTLDSTLNTSSKNTNTPSSVAPLDDDTDISVVKLSAESAPPDLPPPGDLVRYPPRPNDPVYVMRNSNVNGSWVKAKVVEQMQKGSFPGVSSYFTVFKVRIDKPSRGSFMKFVHGKQIAYFEPAPVRLAIGTRVISLFKNSDSHEKRESYYSGIVAEMPTPVNNYRYLIFFDDGYAQYVSHLATRAVCENSPRVWEDVHPDSAEFLRKYLVAYPERPMVRLHAGQMLKTEWNGKWWNSKVLTVDASLVKVYFDSDDRTEWIYRGSTRLLPLFLELQAAERHRPRGLTRANKLQGVKNMPYVEYIRSEEDEKIKTMQTETLQQEEKKQRAVAKKSTTTTLPVNVSPVVDSVTSRVVFYTPKSAVKPHKMTPHVCSARCRRTELLTLKELRTYNPLARPLLSGWERVIVRFKGRRIVMYRAPCGRRLRSISELHRYLQLTDSEMGVDLFDFCPDTHCLAEFVLNRCNVSKKDLSHGKENVPVPCVNYYDNSLPEFCSYNTERTPTAGVPLNLDPEFLCGCDCTDDCQDKSKCACWKTTLEGAKTIGLEGNDLGYVYRRLPEPLPSGIFECNSRCSCRNTCLNRVAQHPLQLKLQVFKTLNRGWGIRALNDIPKGAFLCVYAGNLLTDATANLDGLNEGDEYLAELDYIEVVEQMKEGYEEDIPDADKEKDKKSSDESDEDDEAEDSGNEQDKNREEDDDFRPTIEPIHNNMFSKRLRKRGKKKDGENEKTGEPKKPISEDDCITISDDEEVRKPSRFTAQAGMDGEYVPKHKSVRTLFGKDEACYIMDAKVQGNIGRYLNHSCSPNVFVQNVFVDTHDPRFPWVAFFALRPIGAGTELTWNYNYDIGSVPGKLMYCHCGAPNCRGRLL